MVVGCKMFDWTSFQLLRQRGTILDFVVIWAVILTALRNEGSGEISDLPY